MCEYFVDEGVRKQILPSLNEKWEQASCWPPSIVGGKRVASQHNGESVTCAGKLVGSAPVRALSILAVLLASVGCGIQTVVGWLVCWEVAKWLLNDIVALDASGAGTPLRKTGEGGGDGCWLQPVLSAVFG